MASMPLFWFQYLCGFSSQLVYEFSYMLLYNILFSATPVAALGIFERDVSKDFTHLVPAVYQSGVTNASFKRVRFWTFMLEGMYQSLVCFYVTLAVYNETAISFDGHIPIDVEMGSVMAILAILNANLFCFSRLHSKTLVGTLFIMLPNLILIVWTLIYGFFPGAVLKEIGHRIFATPTFYLTLLIGIVICNLPRQLVLFAKQLFRPTDIQLIQELESLGMKIEPEPELAEEIKYPFGCQQSRLSVTSKMSIQRPGVSLGPTPNVSYDAGKPPSFEAKISPVVQSPQMIQDSAPPSPQKVHFDAPKIKFSPASPSADSSPVSSGLRKDQSRISQNSMSESLAERRSIHMNVMTRGLDIDQRGFSFSESPGVRDLILGRKDVRLNSYQEDEEPSPAARLSIGSTRSVPTGGMTRPRANTFTYVKRNRRFSLSASSFKPEVEKLELDEDV